MYKPTSIFVAALAVIFVTGQHAAAQYPAQAKIMTYNINAETHTDGDYTDIGDVIKAINPTIAGLQKVDSCTVTSQPVDVLKSLGEQTGMKYTFSVSYSKNNGSYGNGFLSDSVPKSSRHLAIPKGSATEDRSALEIGITMGGEAVRVIVTHLDYGSAANRTSQLQQIVSWIDQGGAATVPAVIMADFNANSTESSMKVLTDAGFVFVKGKNGVVLDSTQKINHILYRPESRWKINDAGNPVYPASNRNPLWADMELVTTIIASVPSIARKSTTGPELLVSGNLLRYRLDAPADISLRLFDAAGRSVLTLFEHDRQSSGAHDAMIPFNGLPGGRYHGILSVNGHVAAGTTAFVR